MDKYENVEHTAVYVPVGELELLENNPRTISKEQFEKLKKSVAERKAYFEGRPCLVNRKKGRMVVFAGNQRLRAAQSLGMDKVPCVVYENLSKKEEKELTILDNGEFGRWDMEILANEFSDLPLEELMGESYTEALPRVEVIEDDPADIEPEDTYSIIGDIYQLGEHRVFCGSFEDDEKVRQLFGDRKAVCTFTDPPYNVAVKSRTTGKTIQNDNMKHEDFQSFLNRAFECVAANMVHGGGCISWMSDTEILTLKSAMDNAGMNFKTVLCWVKDHFTLGGGDFQSAKELAIYSTGEGKFARGGDETSESEYACYSRSGGHFTNSRKLSNVWFFDKPKKSAEHPTMKPVGLCAKGILAMSEPGDIVFDPFSGSGSTLIACEQTGRVCYGCEIDPKYCDVIRKRWVKFTTGSEDNWEALTPRMELA